MSDHYAVVEVDRGYLDRLAALRPVTDKDRAQAYTYHVECSDPESCNGWWECDKPHEVDGVNANAGPEGDDHDCGEPGVQCPPWCDEEMFEFHGEMHEWREDWGWTVTYPGCIVAAMEAEIDDLLMDRTGRYLLDADWYDETTLYLSVASGVTA